MKRLLFVSNLFPNERAPTMASFNRQQVESLAQLVPVDVVAPVPWRTRPVGQWLKPLVRGNGSGQICHPTYFYPPGMLRSSYGSFYYLSSRESVRRLSTQNDYSAILGTWLFPDGWACGRFSRELGVPLFLKVHGTDVNGLKPGSRVTRKALEALKQARAVFCVSKALKSRLVELGAPADRLHVLYNGIDTQLFTPGNRTQARKGLGLPGDRKYLLYVGNLKQSKGLAELVEAFSRVEPTICGGAVELLLVGQGPFERSLREKVTSLGLDRRVRFLGGQPLEKIPMFMNACDLLCLPSYMEGVPNVILEAMACGLPVVATDVGGIPELAERGGDINLVPPRAVAPLADAMRGALEANRRANAIAWPSWSDNAREMYRLMRECL
ncbi:MAG: glycosyltransferase family 4 protein [Geothermobacteraceae bacterium]